MDSTDQQKSNQISDYHDEIRQIELEGHELGVKKARNALFSQSNIKAFHFPGIKSVLCSLFISSVT